MPINPLSPYPKKYYSEHIMAADICSELPSLGTSPRISFSCDLNQIDNVSTQDELDFRFDFDFNFPNEKRFAQEISPADELFSDGKILPLQIKVPNSKQKQAQIPDREPAPSHRKTHSKNSTNANPNTKEETTKKRLKEFLNSSFEFEDEKPFSKIFRQLRRTTSLNMESGRAKSLMRPLQFLSRSNSTGSALDPKQNLVPNVSHKANLYKQSRVSLSRSSSSSSPGYYPYNSSKRPQLKKNWRPYANGVRITPILHISHSCMAFGSASLFGIGSFFCNRKAKKKKK